MLRNLIFGSFALATLVAAGEMSSAETPAPTPAELKKRYAERTQAMHEAAEKGQVSLLLELLKSGADVNDKDDQGRTALHKAAEKGNRSAAIMLLMFGADVGEKDAKGLNALHVAAAAGNSEIVTLFCKPYEFGGIAGDFVKGAVSDTLKTAGFNLKSATDKLTALSGTSMTAADSTGQTPIMKAAAAGQTDCVKAIGIYNDKSKDKQGRTTLMLAAMGGHADLIRSIFGDSHPNLEYLQATDAEGKTALQLAEAAKSTATVVLLKDMEQKAQAELLRQKLLTLARENDVGGLKGELARNSTSPTAELMLAAASNGNTQVVRMLMEILNNHPVEEKVRLTGFPLAYGTRPQSAFHLAASNGHLETLKALTDLEWWKDNATLADVLKRKDLGQTGSRTPLESASNSTISEFLTKKFAELEGKGK
jgi:ankyrin repeat protein